MYITYFFVPQASYLTTCFHNFFAQSCEIRSSSLSFIPHLIIIIGSTFLMSTKKHKTSVLIFPFIRLSQCSCWVSSSSSFFLSHRWERVWIWEHMWWALGLLEHKRKLLLPVYEGLHLRNHKLHCHHRTMSRHKRVHREQHEPLSWKCSVCKHNRFLPMYVFTWVSR